MRRVIAPALALLSGAGLAEAQLAESAGYALAGFELASGSGGASSLGHAGFAALDEVGGLDLASSAFLAQVGFLGTFDPAPTLLPVVFGVTPPFGPMEGGTVITISGINFDKLGAAAPVTVDVAGTPATGVVVASDTSIQALTPAAEPGPHFVEVGTSFGTTQLAGGFIHTPALTTPPSALLGRGLDFVDYGPVGGIYQIYFSPFATSIPLPPWGTLLIGPTNVFALGPLQVYPAPDGVGVFSLLLPGDPTLSGATLHFQTLAVLAVVPDLVLQFTNRSSVLLLLGN